MATASRLDPLRKLSFRMRDPHFQSSLHLDTSIVLSLVSPVESAAQCCMSTKRL